MGDSGFLLRGEVGEEKEECIKSLVGALSPAHILLISLTSSLLLEKSLNHPASSRSTSPLVSRPWRLARSGFPLLDKCD